MGKHKKWTEEELDILRKNKGEKTNLQLARMVGCSKEQVMYVMKKHRIKRTEAEIDALWEKWEPIHRKLISGTFNKPKHSGRAGRDKYGDKDPSVDFDDLFRQL